jgi:hypothetical protein
MVVIGAFGINFVQQSKIGKDEIDGSERGGHVIGRHASGIPFTIF